MHADVCNNLGVAAESNEKKTLAILARRIRIVPSKESVQKYMFCHDMYWDSFLILNGEIRLSPS